MNSECPGCGTRLLDLETDLVAHTENGPGTVGGLFFCSEQCRDGWES
jgi:hypothetical protein